MATQYFSLQAMMSAYIDPGTGSFIIQLLMGFLFGSLLAVKLFWNRIRGLITRLLSKGKNANKGEG